MKKKIKLIFSLRPGLGREGLKYQTSEKQYLYNFYDNINAITSFHFELVHQVRNKYLEILSFPSWYEVAIQ